MRQFMLRPAVYFGENALSALEALAGKRVMIVTDGFLAHKSGLLEQVKACLPGCTISLFDQVTPDPPLRLVAGGVRAMEEAAPEALVAFGGGSPMDCAQAMRHFSSRPHIPLWAVPTTAGTGSEVTSFAVLTDTEKGVKYPLVDDALLPDAAVLEEAFLAGVPPAVTADTGMDVLTHAAEGYVAKGASPFSDALAEHAFALAWRALPAAYRGDMQAKGEMLLASCLAGIAFNAAGLGICHGLAHSLGGRIHLPHGRINALLLPHVIRFNAEDKSAARKYGRLAALCGLSGTARALSSALTRRREELGISPRLGETADFAAVAAAAKDDICTPSNPRDATADELERLLKELI